MSIPILSEKKAFGGVELDDFSGNEALWTEFRHLMPVARRWAYLDHAAVSPLPAPSCRALVEWAEEASINGDVNWAQWERQVEGLRTKAATLLGATTEEIALLRSTSEGVNLVAEGVSWEPGDNVVTLAMNSHQPISLAEPADRGWRPAASLSDRREWTWMQ